MAQAAYESGRHRADALPHRPEEGGQQAREHVARRGSRSEEDRNLVDLVTLRRVRDALASGRRP